MESFEDFYIVLAYLTFFLEKRPALVWDSAAQSDLLRILFFDAGDITETRKLSDLIQKNDSRRRNMRAVHGKIARKLKKEQEKGSASDGTREHIAALNARRDAAEESLADVTSRLEALEIEWTRLSLPTIGGGGGIGAEAGEQG